MTKIDIYSGFLGAGKTTLIKKMIQEAYRGEQLVLIENEFGEIGIDGGFLQDAGINITEMNSGCICCSLVGDFGKALHQVIEQYHPDRIVIEPSGVGKLSDVEAAVEKVTGHDVVLDHTVAVVDAGKVKVYMKNFGEFYNNQVETAQTIVLSRTGSIPQSKLDAAVELLRQHNDHAALVVAPWEELTGEQLLEAMDGQSSLHRELEELEHHAHHCCHGHHHDEDEEEHHCCHGHHHDEGEEEHHCCHGHHHDEDGEEHHCCHGHHHDEDEEEHHCCHGHHHDHDHHHHADEVFTSWGVETARKFTVDGISAALKALDSGAYGVILRAKGIVACADGGWIHFDYVPEEENVRMGSASVIGKLCVIGSGLNEQAIAQLFGV